LEQQGVEFDIVDYLKHPPKRNTLTELVEMLPNEPVELIRTDRRFKELGLDVKHYQSGNDVVDLLLQYPELLQRPLAVCNGRAIIGRPPEKVLELIETS